MLRPAVFPAIGARADKLHGEIAHIKSMRPPLGQRDLVQGGAIQIHDFVAGRADQVVVAMNHGIEARGRARVVNAAIQTQFDQRVEDSIDGSAGDLRTVKLHGLEHLIRRRVVRSLQQHLQYRAALVREGDSLRTADVVECLQSILAGFVHG